MLGRADQYVDLSISPLADVSLLQSEMREPFNRSYINTSMQQTQVPNITYLPVRFSRNEISTSTAFVEAMPYTR